MTSKQLLFRSAARITLGPKSNAKECLLLSEATMTEKPEPKKDGSPPLDSEA
jgi:hypothetical protein